MFNSRMLIGLIRVAHELQHKHDLLSFHKSEVAYVLFYLFLINNLRLAWDLEITTSNLTKSVCISL